MKSLIIAAFSTASALTVSAATFTWDDKGDHLWTSVANWTTNGVPATTSPDAGDTVVINNVNNAPAFVILDAMCPPIPTEEVERGYLNSLTLAGTATDNVFLSVTNNAVLEIKSATATEIFVGERGTAHLLVSDGARVETISNGQRNVTVGGLAGSTGTVTVSTGGSMYTAYSTTIGNLGVGTVHVKGGSYTIMRNSNMGSGVTGSGQLLLDSGTFYMPGGQTLNVGNSGKAYIRFLAPTTASFGVLILGVNANSYGELDLDACNAAGGQNNSVTVGSLGKGLFTIRGGTYTATGSAGLNIRANAGASGLLKGWGILTGFRNMTNNDLVIADGEGADRELSFTANRYDGFISNTIDNERNGTNGWYAISKGKLTIQMRGINGANTGLGRTTSEFSWGETETDEDIDLVNSFRVSFNGVAANGTFKASILAPDRDDLPPLPNMPVVGLWNAAFTQSFASVDFECRYDHTRVPSSHEVRLMRWDDDAGIWRRLHTYSTATPDSPHRVKTDDMPELGADRVGLIGAFAYPASFLFILR